MLSLSPDNENSASIDSTLDIQKVATLNSKLEAIFDKIAGDYTELEWVPDSDDRYGGHYDKRTSPSPISKKSRQEFQKQVKELHALEDEILSSCPKNPDGSPSTEEEILEIFFNIKLPNPPDLDNIDSYLHKLRDFGSRVSFMVNDNPNIDTPDDKHITNDFYVKLCDLSETKKALCETLGSCINLSNQISPNIYTYYYENRRKYGELVLTKQEFKSLKSWLTYLMTVSGLTALKSDISYLHKMINREPPTNFVEKLFEIISHAMTAFNRYLAHIRFDWKMERNENAREDDEPELGSSSNNREMRFRGTLSPSAPSDEEEDDKIHMEKKGGRTHRPFFG
jgi:hypothetical protein